MDIGKLNTYFQIYERAEAKNEVGQRSILYSQVGEVRGQHVIRNMTSNMNANRENPVVSEYVYTYYDPNIKPRNFLVDEFGAQYVIASIRKTNDRSLLQCAVQQVTVKELDTV